MGPYLLASFLLLLAIPDSVLPQEQEIVSQQPEESPFDVGPVGDCRIPQTSYCMDVVTYEVPASIAELTSFIEFEIMGTAEEMQDDQGPGSCKDVYKETLCRKKFPRCSTEQNQVYYEAVQNCEDRLRSSCDEAIVRLVIKLGYCNSTQFDLHSGQGSCRSLSSYNQTGELQHCNSLESNILISDWMYEYIRLVDLTLQNSLYLSGGAHQRCWLRYGNFLCGALGQCLGGRVQLLNTQEDCEAVLNW
jgi:hypothetical protein